VLKIFAGGDGEALAPERLAWHQAKVAELEGYLSAVGDADDERLRAGRRNALLAGIAYHQAMIELMERLRAGAARTA
jgi:hypothetical protein